MPRPPLPWWCPTHQQERRALRTMDLSIFIVSVFCLIDDWLQGRHLSQRGPEPTLAVIARGPHHGARWRVPRHRDTDEGISTPTSIATTANGSPLL
jgi:hypothetical protein